MNWNVHEITGKKAIELKFPVMPIHALPPPCSNLVAHPAGHENSPEADLIVIDDVAELQMPLAEYNARQLNSDYVEALRLEPAEREALSLLHAQIGTCVQTYAQHNECRRA